MFVLDHSDFTMSDTESEVSIHEQFHDDAISACIQMSKGDAVSAIPLLESMLIYLRKHGQHDPEAAHQFEDSVMRQFFKCFASNIISGPDAFRIARIICDMNNLDHPRWYA